MLLEGVVAHANEVIDPHEARATQRRFILLSIPMRGNEHAVGLDEVLCHFLPVIDPHEG